MHALSAPRRILNPVTGDRIEFLSSPLHGESGPLVFRCTLPPDAKGSPLHLHRTIFETFDVEQGALEMEVAAAGNVRTLSAGDRVDLAPGLAHSFRNPLSETTVFVSTASPGAAFEKFLRSMYGLAAEGGTNSEGMPKDPRALALTLHYADLVIPALPRGAQAALVNALTGLARLTGLERDFDRYWPGADQALVIEGAR